VNEMVLRPVLLDTNIASTFAKIDDLNFIFILTGRSEIYISTSVLHELEEADFHGLVFVKPILNLIECGTISILSMTNEESRWSMNLPNSFGKGERDSLALCKYRNGIFLTNERKIINFCDRESIDSMNLSSILRYSWRSGLKTKEEVLKMIRRIEEKDNVRFKEITSILED